MTEPNDHCPGCRLTPDAVDGAKRLEGDAEAGVLPVTQPSGKDELVLLVRDDVAEQLASALGYFGGTVAVKIFAAVTLADLCLHDVARAVGGDDAEFRSELEHLEAGGFVYRRSIGGVDHFVAGNPSLKRFFTKRFGPGKKIPE